MTLRHDLAPEPTTQWRPRVLIVEDDILIRLTHADTLRSDGWEVIEAGTGYDALAALDRVQVDLVFTDVHMPGSLTGLQLAKAIRERAPSIIIVVTSGEQVPTDKEAHLFHAFLPKPVFDVVRALRKAMELASK